MKPVMLLDGLALIGDSRCRCTGAAAHDDLTRQVPATASDMTMTTKAEPLGSTDSMFRAFSDRTRLRILHVLQDGELCVGDIVEILQAPQPRVSRHLAYLRKASLVTVRRSGLWSHYSLAPANTPFHRKLLECLSKCFSEVPELQADALRVARIRKSGGCCPKK